MCTCVYTREITDTSHTHTHTHSTTAWGIVHPTKVRYGRESWVEIKPPEGPRTKGVVKNVVGAGDYVVWLPRCVCVFEFVGVFAGAVNHVPGARCFGRGLWVWWTSESIVNCTYRETAFAPQA